MKQDSFENIIKSYLEERSKADELFSKSFTKPNKSITECCSYIMGEAKKQGNAVAMTNEEVYNLAVHYYDEDNLKVNKVYNARVSTPTPVTLTEEDKAAAKERALRAYEAVEQKKLEEREKARKEALKKKAAQQQEVQPSLFEF